MEESACEEPCTGQTGPSRHTPAPRPANTLVAEDDILLGEIIARMLAKGGHRATVVRDGAKAVAEFKRDDYDLVLTDLGLPGMSGWEVVEEIKRHRVHTPVAVITGKISRVEQSGIGINGADRVLAKPFDMAELLQLVATLTQPTA